MMFFLAVAFALLPGASSVPWPGPAVTPTNKLHAAGDGWSPATTSLPEVPGNGYELFKRQGLETCGFISGVACECCPIFRPPCH